MFYFYRLYLLQLSEADFCRKMLKKQGNYDILKFNVIAFNVLTICMLERIMTFR